MLTQFEARYRITVFTTKETITIEYPLTCDISISRNVMSDTNSATVKIYNLAPATRNSIFQDQFYNFNDTTKHKYIHIEAGYGDSLPLIFKGRILQAYSYKSGGQTDVITEIQAIPFDIFTCNSSHQFAAGTTFKEALKILASDMPNVTVGSIGNLEGQFQTPTTFDGNTMEQINKLTGGHTFVDNGVLHTLFDNEALYVPVPVLDSNANLLETPMRRDAYLEVKSLFLPELQIGQLVEIKSGVADNFDGQYKLVGFTHNLLFSETQAGTRITQMMLWIGPLLPASNIALTGSTSDGKEEGKTTGGASPTNGFKQIKDEEIIPVDSKQPASVREVYNFLQKNSGAIPSTKITNNISWKEMLGNDNTSTERKSQVTIGVLTNVYTTAQRLQGFIDKYYPGRKVTITSGWRSVENNRKCGGHPRSKHIYGLAVDFNVNGATSNDVYNKLTAYWTGYVKQYAKFCHAQLDFQKGKANDK